MQVLVKRSALEELIKKLTEDRNLRSIRQNIVPEAENEEPIVPSPQMALQLTADAPPVNDPEYVPASTQELARSASAISQEVPQEIKRRTIDFFATQNRAVTQTDYEALVYALPEKFGSIKRCKVIRDPDSLRRNLNLYVISEDSSGKLSTTNSTIKENVKVWLNRNKMISDTIDILDARIVNIGMEFEVIVDEESNKFQILADCTNAIKNIFFVAPYIGEPLYITDIFSALNRVDGVVDTKRINIVKKVGSSYATTKFDIDEALSADGRYLSVPQNVILELKYPDTDIKGAVT